MMMPISCTSARSLRVPTPSSQTATSISANTGNTPIRLVLIDRMNVWLIARLACSAKVRRVVCWKPWVFSSTLSNTMTVS
ncbi:Uncharacterised protein [Mycobacterium tuberculosis]|uniref:Uncharacterized protein n=1 Tax=Mycobacterium tuberculosis TaxID=1773 RepID=A0A655AMV2_MYCTX|nr:Uncharacterised protein [Mycobacterium tuberculosis]CKT28612.1 Uncharacterised protein [Mycobacterium tuberculosis]CKT50753.1 Uncharacterised protein [Mycobacterium tuberculosis]CNN20579.1 Uncharacterised protein [Mycobacterium tuberculosis]